MSPRYVAARSGRSAISAANPSTRRQWTNASCPSTRPCGSTRGNGKPVKKLLFPGYVFLVSNHAEDLAKSLEKMPYSARMLGAGDDTYTALADGERDWFLSFMDGKHCVRMSEGYIEGDKVVVTRGPLLGLEGDIRKIDRHKRRAYLDATMFGRTMPISVGLEVVRKTSNAA